MNEIGEFIIFLKNYFLSRLMSAGQVFEGIKDVIVAFLIVKRGKYSSSFLNTSFLMIVAATVVGGPAIAENTPFLQSQSKDYQAMVVSYNPYGGNLGTIYSVKPEIIQYKVVSGDALSSIAKRFNLTVDSIKWSNNLKGDVIKPGQTLTIPPFDGIVIKVEAGDTVYSIAKEYKVSAQNIVNYQLNDFADADTFALNSGQTLFVPGGVIEDKPIIQTQFIASIQAGVRGSSNFIWPTSGMITQYPVIYHMALDIANPSGPAVLAADSGTVAYAGWSNVGYGNMVLIDHGNGYQTLYGHMSSILVSSGQGVSQGQQVGVMGSTGRSTGTHLHFEIRSGGQLQNPLDYLK